MALTNVLSGETRKKLVAIGVISSILVIAFTVVYFGFPQLGEQDLTYVGHENSPVFTIDFTVSNDFSDFKPYSEEFTVNVSWYTIAAGLANVVNLNDYPQLTSSDLVNIQTNGFTAVPSQFDQIYDILQSNDDNDIPSFVSSDAVLHAFHVLYDLALRETEVYTFWNLLGNLTESLVSSSYDQYQTAPDGRWKDAALRNVMYFSVAQYLLDNQTILYPEVVDEVTE